MKILSIDVGMKNMAYCLLDYKDDGVYTIADWDIIDLCEKNENLKKYDLQNNKGYGTKKHMEAIKEFGIVEGHRKSFKPCSNYV